MPVKNQVTIVRIASDDEKALPAALETLEALEAKLVPLLPAATQERLAAFTHAARRRQTLWGRLAALAIARERGLTLVETPPYSPLLRDAAGHETALSIAHTGNVIAVGAAGDADPLMGLDIETVRPVRSVRAMSETAFGADIAWAADRYDKTGDLEPFFLLWGMKEAEIKLNRGGDAFLLTKMTDTDGTEIRPEVIEKATGKAVALHTRKTGRERLTVLTRCEEPLYFTVTAEALARRLLSGEN